MKYFIIILSLLFLIALICLIIAIIGARSFHLSTARLTRSKTSKNDTDDIRKLKENYTRDITPEALKKDGKKRLIFFSDLHAEYCFMPREKFCDLIGQIASKTDIDAVVFGGDICNKAHNAKVGIEYMQAIAAKCKESDIPFLGVTGNHDVGLTPEQIASCGFTDLRGTFCDMGDYIISGINDSGRENRVWASNPITEPAKRHILVSHNPDWLLEAAKTGDLKGIDHMLSGHIHGGQIRLPFNIENLAIRKDLLPKRRIIDGVFDGAGMTFFISRGLGCVLLPFRFFADPEITIVEFD